MDLQKIKVRQDLARMVYNYFLSGKITEQQANSITSHIDNTIGGGNPYVEHRAGCKVYSFTGEWQGSKEGKEEAAQAPAGPPPVFFAPYGEPVPDGLPDFREALQRDGLILIRWNKYNSKQGIFFDVLWCRSKGDKRLTAWSGYIREEEIPYALPLDNEDHYWGDNAPVLHYTVDIAPDSVLNEAFSEFPAYVQSLKDQGIKVNFDYDYVFALEKRNRYLKKYKDIIALNLPPRVLNVFTDAGITTVKEIKAIPINKLRTIPKLGERTIQELIAALEKNNITLQEEESNVL